MLCARALLRVAECGEVFSLYVDARLDCAECERGITAALLSFNPGIRRSRALVRRALISIRLYTFVNQKMVGISSMICKRLAKSSARNKGALCSAHQRRDRESSQSAADAGFDLVKLQSVSFLPPVQSLTVPNIISRWLQSPSRGSRPASRQALRSVRAAG